MYELVFFSLLLVVVAVAAVVRVVVELVRSRRRIRKWIAERYSQRPVADLMVSDNLAVVLSDSMQAYSSTGVNNILSYISHSSPLFPPPLPLLISTLRCIMWVYRWRTSGRVSWP